MKSPLLVFVLNLESGDHIRVRKRRRVSQRVRHFVMLRSSLRMIFTERVLGRSAENRTSSGRAKAPLPLPFFVPIVTACTLTYPFTVED